MVVSAILTTALAPVTGALFGASYGTAIRIGYEIIFPALFGNVKANPDAQDVIKSLHTMFTATGGASAMEFGINQGIEMAKKKTESQEMQNLINTNLGITEKQLARRHLINSQANVLENERVQDLLNTYQFPDPNAAGSDKFFDDVEFLIRNFSSRQIHIWYKDIINGSSTHPQRNQQMIIAAYNQLFDEGGPDTIPPGEKFFLDELPNVNDAIKRDFDKNHITFRDAWVKALNIYGFHLKKPRTISTAASASLRLKGQKIIDDNAARELSIAKNTTLDKYKKLTNFLIISQNNPIIRVMAAQALRAVQLIGSLGNK